MKVGSGKGMWIGETVVLKAVTGVERVSWSLLLTSLSFS